MSVLVRRWLPSSMALAAVVFSLQLGFGRLGGGMSFLYIVPICLTAVGGGRRAALAAAAIATLLVAVWVHVEGVPLPSEGYAIRFFAFVVVGFCVAYLELDRRRLLERVHRMAHTDFLTGLPNRRSWDAELDAALARARRSAVPLTIGMVDLDHFKRYNDTHGHSGGDRLLRAAAASWSERLRRSDFLARFGGEEFSFLLWGSDLEMSHELADRLRRATPKGSTCSVGIAVWDGEEDADALLRRADAALYRAKELGRDRVVSFLAV